MQQPPMKKCGFKGVNTMKYIYAFIFSLFICATAFAQSQNVTANTNGVVVRPTNFWSVDASNARTGLGLSWSALTNTNASNFRTAIELASYVTNPVIPTTNGGLGSGTMSVARTNLGLGWPALTNTDATNFRIAIGVAGYISNSGTVVFTNTNTITFTNEVSFTNNVLIGPISGNTISLRSTGGNLQFWDPIDSESVLTIASDTNPVVLGNQWNDSSVRTALGLGWTVLTNTNSTNFLAAIFGSNTNPVLVSTNGSVVSPTNFWQAAPISTSVQYFTNVTVNSTNSATNSRNLFVHSMAVSVSGVTNTINLPTNSSTFNGDTATIIHKGTTTTATIIKNTGSTNTLIALSNYNETVNFMFEQGAWSFAENPSFVEPIFFSGTNGLDNAGQSRTNLGLGGSNDVQFKSVKTAGVGSATNLDIQFDGNGSGIFANTNTNTIGITILSNNVAFFTATNVTFYQAMAFNGTAGASRTNLGIPYTALTNTNSTNFQSAIFQTNTTPSGTSYASLVAWMEVNVITNGVTTSFRIPLFK
jgi:hypothetical protein